MDWLGFAASQSRSSPSPRPVSARRSPLHTVPVGVSCPMQNLKRRPDWAAIKTAYLAGDGSFRALAHQYNVSFHTLAKRAKREGWATQVAKLCDAVATTAMNTATARGEKLGMTAGDLVERSIRETGSWLDRIEALAAGECLTADSLQKLVNSWRATLEVGRTAFGLDSQSEQTVIFGVSMLENAFPIPIQSESSISTASSVTSVTSVTGLSVNFTSAPW